MSEYFQSLPNVRVRIKNTRQNNVEPYVVAKNIFRRVKLIDDISKVILGFQQYTVQNNQRPDQIAYEVYGDSAYDWIVLLCNNITNVYQDWPMSEEELFRYVVDNYGDPDGVHHYETLAVKDDFGNVILKEGIEVNSNFRYYRPDGTAVPNVILPISNYEHERKINEYKENIWLIRPAYVEEFVEEFRALAAYSPHDEIDDDGVKTTYRIVEETFINSKDRYSTRYGFNSTLEFASQQDLVNRTVTTTVDEGGKVTRTVDTVNTGVNASGVVAGTSDASSTAAATEEQTLGYV
ncbi:baseplate wedge component [Synechococcus phage S-SZBM1]|uniref:Baseplate wedge component n=1 Tax=Synechococcus phage S-SZBM1 TaxID=2926475 RepID=A0AC61TSS2_9CAUD|nr:baseplate wedge subunit [Synechococcus phage S-SZBM1]UNH61191.1 baseplate wedge component [Synechococcus phage S-SZBM1]